MAAKTYIQPTTDNELDVATANNQKVWTCLEFETFTVAIFAIDGVLTTGVLTLEWSNNASDWFGFQPAITLTASTSYTAVLDVSGYAFIRLRVSTAEASKRVRVSVCMKGSG